LIQFRHPFSKAQPAHGIQFVLSPE